MLDSGDDEPPAIPLLKRSMVKESNRRKTGVDA
jgi:hypothetical protein